MSIASVVTIGFAPGSDGIALLPTFGFTIGSTPNPPPISQGGSSSGVGGYPVDKRHRHGSGPTSREKDLDALRKYYEQQADKEKNRELAEQRKLERQIEAQKKKHVRNEQLAMIDEDLALIDDLRLD
jgi:hypothetical protein